MSNSEDDITIPPPPTKKIKLSDCENEDRLSDLPESVILHILSFLNAQHAVQTCVLSTRYNDLWKRLPALRLHCRDFRTYKIFTKFVSKILSLRDPSITLDALDFKRHIGRIEPHIFKRIVNYAMKHNVQRLRLNVTSDVALIPTSIYSFQSLTHLKLSVYSDAERKTQFPNCFSLPALTYLKLCIYSNHENLFPDSLDLPALTSLHLQHFTFCVGENECAAPFSTFNRLNSLLINNCAVRGGQTLRLSSATLFNLALYDNKYNCYKIDLRTPSLCTFTFCGNPYQRIFGSNISSLKHVDIHAEVDSYCRDSPPLFLLSWLIEFVDIKSLSVTATTLQVLNLYPDLFKIKLPSLGNLKSLIVKVDEILYGFRLTLCEVKLLTVKSKKEAARLKKAYESGSEPSPTVPDGIVDFLRQNSPSADVEFIDCTKKMIRPRHL